MCVKVFLDPPQEDFTYEQYVEPYGKRVHTR